MDEVVKLVSERAHISQEQAQTAVATVLDFVKQKLPPQYASQVEALISGGSSGSDIAGAVGGLFGEQ
jgi:uncharacterized protein (DUF2267 family)